ncbi:MAG: putative membrane protein [Candidatus Ozemobacter sibiricus]|uniref:Putative membrane protein n=1 Tax=Candidatus Ozemobacter sibiricus TaxID=2268124 RepID=A0A367ZRV9_9BACT|nr:MAG: putative membrane protein [Candidatus Ozemobacter sibiricus]
MMADEGKRNDQVRTPLLENQPATGQVEHRWELPVAVVLGLALVLALPQLPLWWQRRLGAGWVALACLAGMIWLRRRWQGETAALPRWVCGVGRATAVAGTVWCACLHLPIGLWLARPLLLPAAAGTADAIVVLAAGLSDGGQPSFSQLQRILYGARLWREGRAPLLILNAAERNPLGFDDRAATASLAAFLGLPAEHCVIISEGVLTTRTEAQVIRRFLRERGLNRILLVTNGPHIRRASLVFAATGLEVLPAPVQDERTIASANESRLKLTDAAVHEWLGLLWYWLRGDFDPPLKGGPVPSVP